MGNASEKMEDEGAGMPFNTSFIVGRMKAIVGAKPKAKLGNAGARKTVEAGDLPQITEALANLILFEKLDATTLKKIAGQMYEKPCKAGDILIQQGDVGESASQLFVVKSGKFEVLERRKGVMFKVNNKEAGDCFGEISMMYNCPRNATVAATTDSSVWALDRDTFRMCVQREAEEGSCEVEVFINSVPLLSMLSREQRFKLVDAFIEEIYESGMAVITEGETGDKFYIVKEGEACVMIEATEVNRLFKADFFGEQALLKDEPRKATVVAVTNLLVLSLDRSTFISVLGPLEQIMGDEKSINTTEMRMAKLKVGGAGTHNRPRAKVQLKKVTLGHNNKSKSVTTVAAVGHLDEVLELKRGGMRLAGNTAANKQDEDDKHLVLIESELLGEGAFSRVVRVTEETTGRQFALKRMTKASAMQCPEHVFCERDITKNMAHPFCLRQYASFQDHLHLYFLFDLMPGGDLMDVLVAEAKVIKCTLPQKGSLKPDIFSTKMKMWQGMEESLAKFYVASITLALEYIHNSSLVFRDLKPENVLIDSQGFAKLGDFGFAKRIKPGQRTYTFCGTPGYVAPENIMGRGYNQSVDWWTMGVLMYVLLTARQPFTSPRALDPMEVMRRIVDERWPIKYPPYMSEPARDLISRLLERKPVKRIGMLQGRAVDIKSHVWFKGFDWAALSSRRMEPPRVPKPEDSQKRKSELHHMHRADPPITATADEVKGFEAMFKDF